VGVAAVASTVVPPLAPGHSASTDTAVARFYRSLKGDQKARLCFPSDHPLRTLVRPNWAIVEPSIADLTAEQRALCMEVFTGLCSDDGRERFLRQMGEDYGGFESYHVAVFGEPGTDQPFEWVLTGRHVTLRADGHRDGGSPFVGPIFYGHASQGFHEDARHTGNVWWFQAERANALFETLDETQRAQALASRAEPDGSRSTKLRGPCPDGAGLCVGGLDGSQEAMVRNLLRGLLSPFRATDADAIRSCLRSTDGLRFTYFQEGDLGGDGVRDVWKLEGPGFSWYFHGSPHVHAWLNTDTIAHSK
jgi:hypothetical protein